MGNIEEICRDAIYRVYNINYKKIDLRFIASNDIETQFIAPDVDQKETRLIASVREEEKINIGGFSGENNPMLQDNISKIIRWYKGRCSFEIRKFHADFGWHSRFHDNIIRNALSFANIENYIAENPESWQADKFFK